MVTVCMKLVWMSLLLSLVPHSSSHTINIGIIDNTDEMEGYAADFAFSEAKTNPSLNITLFKFKNPDDNFQLATTLNKMDFIAIMKGASSATPVCALSEVNKLPFLRIHNNRQKREQFSRCKYGLSLAVDHSSYGLATLDFIKQKGFKKVALLHDEKHIQRAMQFRLSKFKSPVLLHLVYLEEKSNMSQIRSVKEAMSQIVQLEVDVILLFTGKHHWPLLLKEESYDPENPFVWIIQSELPHSITVAGRNIVVGFRLPRIESSSTNALLNHLKSKSKDVTLTLDSLKESSILMYDAITVVAEVVTECIEGKGRVSTNEPNAWSYDRDDIFKRFKEIKMDGASGIVAFDSKGKRDTKQLDVLNLRSNVFKKVGTWAQSSGVQIEAELQRNIEMEPLWKSIQNRHLRIVTVEEHPFVFRKYDAKGQEYYEGFCIDIIKKLSEMLGFTYEFIYSYDNTYGYKRNGKWTGTIKELIEKNADMTATAMTMTEERAKAVAFTVPYMDFTADILKRKFDLPQKILFQFLDPFSTEVWFMLFVTLIVFGICIFLVNYLSHKEVKDNTGVFNLTNSLWLSLACMLQHGGEGTPRTFSGRILIGVFWFGVLIYVSTYTASLAALFTVRNANVPINNLEDAIESDHVLGLTRGEALYSFFQKTDYQTYLMMWHRMKARDSFTSTTAEGIDRVRRESKYVHIADGPLLKYAASRKPCNLETVPGVMDTQALSFALNQQDPATRNLSLAMLRLRDEGFFSLLEKKWWTDASQCPKQNKNRNAKTNVIQWFSMAGVYIVFAVGTCLAFATLGVEICWHKRRASREGARRFSCRNSSINGNTTMERESDLSPDVNQTRKDKTVGFRG